MNPLCDASKAEEMLKFFKNLMNMAKQMVDEILPDLVIDLDKKVLMELIDVGVDFNKSLEVFVKLCEMIGRKNLKFSSKNKSDENKASAVAHPMVKHVENIVPVDIPTRQEDFPFDMKTDDTFNCESNNDLNQTATLPSLLDISFAGHHAGSNFVEENQRSEKRRNNTASTKIESTKKCNSDVIFRGNKIIPNFVGLTTKITNYLKSRQNFSIHCCLVCMTCCDSKISWDKHSNTAQHVGKMRNPQLFNVDCFCRKCPFALSSNRKLAVVYMSYHIENCHQQSTDKINVDEYMEIICAAPRNRGRRNDKCHKLKSTNPKDMARCSSANDVSFCRPNSANLGSFIRNASSSRSSIDTCSNSGRETPFSGRSTPSVSNRPFIDSNYRTSCRERSTSRESTLDAPISCSNSPKNVTNVPIVNGNDLISRFVAMLDMKEAKFQVNSSHKPFSALCLICLQDFESSFEWLDHITTHNSNDVENEVECSQCNSFLFGNVKDITMLMIPHRAHVRLDSIMKY